MVRFSAIRSTRLPRARFLAADPDDLAGGAARSTCCVVATFCQYQLDLRTKRQQPGGKPSIASPVPLQVFERPKHSSRDDPETTLLDHTKLRITCKKAAKGVQRESLKVAACARTAPDQRIEFRNQVNAGEVERRDVDWHPDDQTSLRPDDTDQGRHRDCQVPEMLEHLLTDNNVVCAGSQRGAGPGQIANHVLVVGLRLVCAFFIKVGGGNNHRGEMRPCFEMSEQSPGSTADVQDGKPPSGIGRRFGPVLDIVGDGIVARLSKAVSLTAMWVDAKRQPALARHRCFLACPKPRDLGRSRWMR